MTNHIPRRLGAKNTKDLEQGSGWLEIGKIIAPQGLNGEVRVYPDSDFPERFEQPGTRWLLCSSDQEPRSIELLSGRYLAGKNLYVVQFLGVENRNQAEALRGCKLLVPESDRPVLGEDEYHVLDLVGLAVIMQKSGEKIGSVVDVMSAGNDLLQVELHQEQSVDKTRTVLIPFVKEIVPVVDLQARCVEITPPPGLMEI